MSLAQHTKPSNTRKSLWQYMLALTAVLLACSPSQAQKRSATTFCPADIRAKHLTTSCLQKNLSEVSNPTIKTTCNRVTSLTFEDSYYELAENTGFQTGYFALDRWTKKSGDGGVDVTGAPNCVLVEGANMAQVSIAPGRTAILEIEVPATGFAMFNWKSVGGSNLLFTTKLNTTRQPIERQGFYRSPRLKAGDAFAVLIENTSENHLKLEIADFEFLTNAIGVTKRQWTAKTDDQNQTIFNQYIAIEQLPLANIIFPENLNEQHAPTLNAEAYLAPAMTGFPIYDEDGEAMTLYDQHELDQLGCAFDYRWKDAWTLDAQGYALQRHWRITDKNGNVREHTQIIRPENISAIPDDLTQPSAGIGKKTSAMNNTSGDYNSRMATL